MGIKEKCAICGGKTQFRFNPMEEWRIQGSLCGNCYSKKINEHYPGEHVRVNKDLD
ncbi:MAG: hypothetical protein HKM23_05125 [Nitrosopumilus sp.]|nr:hypothetical protein [Nitrosopumilus sp.]NNL58345.1 hypothetical protein [Nitrosopumilus sp.]